MSTRAPETLPNRLAWAARAACQGQDLALFFSDAEQKVAQAKQICAACPVRRECLDEALRAEGASIGDGVFGGLTADERTELALARATEQAAAQGQAPPQPRTGRRPAPCGTRSAYQRHVKKGEPIDDACRAANTAADRRLRTTGSTRPRR
ncbi:WhiB family transcriptional regulator [Streptomyces pseudogriseolus]|uniref:WhiB family transcriptional regulator n=1 Tax=Streptomyces pseudogriseolus TaxID=36817 RepID=UPI00368A485C